MRQVVLDAGDLHLSGLLAEPDGAPRALVLALPGGGMTSGYFHRPAYPDLSLLRLGQQVGFSVLSLDRPGYGVSQAQVPEGQSLEDQAITVSVALEGFRAGHDTGAGLFLVGHSLGLMVALHIAAAAGPETVLGLDGSGAAHRHLDIFDRPLWERFWGSERLYPPGMLGGATRPTAPVPPIESGETDRWPSILPALAARVRVPYQFTVAEHEHWWQVTDRGLVAYRAMFSAAPSMVIRRQPYAGHNISLGWAARSYHMHALAFAEQTICQRRIDGKGDAGSLAT